MSPAEDDIAEVKARIEGYKREYKSAATPAEKRLLLQAITAGSNELNALLRASFAPARSAGKYFPSCWSTNRIVSH